MPLKPNSHDRFRRVCFVTGTRAEFGLMRSALEALRRSPGVELQIIATGMHLGRRHGYTLEQIAAEGWRVNATTPWGGGSLAEATGAATADLAGKLRSLRTDIVLVVGDRVEALAGAAAGHLLGIAVAHVHGGDRALGQVDDCLRHCITKLAHLHFPATRQSAERIFRLGEDRWRIHRVGSPGVDGIADAAGSKREIAREFPQLQPRAFGLVILHPVDADEDLEYQRAKRVAAALSRSKIGRHVIVFPNNDPGSRGIERAWRELDDGERFIVRRNLPRRVFLGLLRDAAVLVGNSSSGLIEAGSFGTPVLDIGPRQRGRERSRQVRHVGYSTSEIAAAIRQISSGRPRRKSPNIYGKSGAGRRIASVLRKTPLDARLLRKLIRY